MTINLDQYTNTLNVTDTATNADLNVTTKGTGAVKLKTGNGEQFRVKDNGATTTDFVFAVGSNFGRPVIGAQTISGSGNASLGITAWGTSGVIQLYTNNTAQEQARISHTASAVNYVQVTGGATGSFPSITAQGSDTNIDFVIRAKGSFSTYIGNSNGYGITAYAPASTVYYFQTAGSPTGSGITLSAQGADSNIQIYYASKGTNPHSFLNGAGNEQLRVASTASAVNYVQVTGAATGGTPTISAQGSDANPNLALNPKGTGGLTSTINGGSFTVTRNSGINIMKLTAAGTQNLALQATGGGAVYLKTGDDALTQFVAQHNGSAVNYLQATGGATGFGAVLSAQGSDTNINVVVQPKGTGALQAQQTDSTATGGNARGAYSVDWQTSRASATQVGSGAYSFIGAGLQNTVSSYGGVLGGGGANFASSNAYTVTVGGTANNTSGERSAIVGGASNTAAGYLNFIGAGFTNSGTSGSAVTTQSGTMNGTTAVTLSGSNANIKVGQYITGTSISGDTYVAAISGTSLTLSKVASGSSTSTLSFYTPHGVVVGGGNNTATGSYSFIGGGGDAGTAGNRNVASGDWSVVGGGQKNVASSNYSFVGSGGYNIASTGYGSVVCGGGFYGNLPTQFAGNVASGTSSFIGSGFSNQASGFASFIGSGNSNLSNSVYGAVFAGSVGTTRSIVGNHVFSASNVPIASALGVAQSALLILARETTNATPTVLCSDASAASSGNQVIMPNNSAYFFTGEVVAGVTGGGNTKGWTIEGVIKRGANAASTALVGTPTVTSTYADAGASTWVIAVTADTTNGGLAVTFTGQLATTIRCVAQIRTTEMTF